MRDVSPAFVGFGLAVRQLRRDGRMTQEALALRTGVHRNYIGGIERAERNPTLEAIESLADGLGVRLGELFGLADELAPRQS